ncbi:mitogen-activated protein kinase kinase kinase 20-like [Rhodamnia argentea]|uniref:Mitogen-activated protein kinase kinase kinase 20-like n=1 Tax=Rhodamnia argentea TaxID=178133 RepID=A0ABM3GVB9_9MYRT|nr:mitogen-activated protein kinase kinase kinase 20-like [Rhodamnia argentea]
MDWVRGKEIGRGGFSTVHLATPAQTCSSDHTPVMAVKSCDAALSSSLRHETRVLSELGDCPRIVRCFGDALTGCEELYNVLLEYAAGGSLADSLKSRGKPLWEPEIRGHTRSILQGLEFVHSKGYVHCDVKLQNILVFPNGGGEDVKIADFGLAKRAGERLAKGGKLGGFEWRGTPMFMAPESVNRNEYEPPSDIWALGCAVVEMATGRPAWGLQAGSNAYALMIRIGVGDEIPEIPEGLSEQGKDFLTKCFTKNPKKRWTARMLLKHPFLALDGALNDEEVVRDCGAEFTDSSPRCHFDFQDWVSTQCSRTSWESGSLSPSSEIDSDPSLTALEIWADDSSSVIDRIGELASQERPNWEHSEGWVTVR